MVIRMDYLTEIRMDLMKGFYLEIMTDSCSEINLTN